MEEIKNVTKILDYDRSFDNVQASVHKKVLWPCRDYLIPVKVPAVSTLNIFDQLILKMTVAGVQNTAELACYTGMEPDLVSFIINRLQHRGWLDAQMKPTSHGLALINKATESETVNYFHVYQDALSGQLLSIVVPHGQEVLVRADDRELVKDGFRIRRGSSAGKESDTGSFLRAFSFPDEREPSRGPDSKDLQSLFSRYMAEAQNSLPRQGFSFQSDNMKCEDVYLSVDLILQKGESRFWLVSDGFGKGFSPVLENSISLLCNRDRNWLERQRKSVESGSGISENYEKKNNDPVSFIVNTFQKCESLMKGSGESKSSDEQRSQNTKMQEALIGLYQVMEHTFYHLTQDSLYLEEDLRFFWKLNRDYLIGKQAVSWAEALGFSGSDKLFPLFRMSPGSLKYSLKKNSASLWPLIVMHLKSAERGVSHPIRVLAGKYPDALSKLAELKGIRDKAVHADADYIELSVEILKMWYQIIHDYLTLSIPEVMNSAEDSESLKRDVLPLEVRRRKAESEAACSLGYAMIRSLPEKWIDLIVEAESYFLEGENCGFSVRIMSALLEQIFHTLNNQLLKEKGNIPKGAYYGDKARAKLEQCEVQFSEQYEGTMKALFRVGNPKVKRVLEGLPSTLGGEICGWILRVSLEEINALKKHRPYRNDYSLSEGNFAQQLFYTTARIADLRKHGFCPEPGTYTREELIKAKSIICDFIKYLYFTDKLN